MAVSTIAKPRVYDTDGSTDEFDIPWTFDDNTYVEVIYQSPASAITPLDLNADYTIIGDEVAGYKVKTDTVYPADGQLYVGRKTAAKQEVPLRDTVKFPAAAVALISDRFARMIQDVEAQLGVTLQVPKTEYSENGPVFILPARALRGSKVLVFDENGDPDLQSRVNVDTVASLEDNIIALSVPSVVAGLQNLSPAEVVAGLAALAQYATEIQALAATNVLNAMTTLADSDVLTRLAIVESLQDQLTYVENASDYIQIIGSDLVQQGAGNSILYRIGQDLDDPDGVLNTVEEKSTAATNAAAAADLDKQRVAVLADGDEDLDLSTLDPDLGLTGYSVKHSRIKAEAAASTATTKAAQTTSDAALTLGIAGSISRYYGGGLYATPAAAVAANPYLVAGSSIVMRDDNVAMLMLNVSSGTEAWQPAIGYEAVNDKTHLLTKFAGASDGDTFYIKGILKPWKKTTANISTLVALDVDGVYAISSGDGSAGGFLADIVGFDIADPDLGIPLDNTDPSSDNHTKLNRLSAIAAAAQSSSVSRWPIYCSQSQGEVRLSGTLWLNQSRVTFKGPGSEGFRFVYTPATGDAIQIGGASTAAKTFSASFEGAAIWANNTDHMDGAGLFLQHCDRVVVRDAPQYGFHTGIAKRDCDHIRITESPGHFQNRTSLALYQIEDRDDDDANTRGFNTSQYAIFADYHPNDLFGGCCLRAYHRIGQCDGNWNVGPHTYGGAIGLLLDGNKGNAGDRHLVSYNSVAGYYDRAGLCNIVITGANVKSTSITGFEARENGTFPCLDRDLTTPPGSPSVKDMYVMPSGTLTGDWSTFTEGDVVVWDGTEWVAMHPCVGTLLWIYDEDIIVEWDGSAYQTVTWLEPGFGIYAKPDAGETIAGIKLNGKVWQSARGAAKFDKGTGTIEHLGYDLYCYDNNTEEDAGQADIYVNVSSGYGTSAHGGNISTGKCVEIAATCGDNFTLGPVAKGESQCATVIDDPRDQNDVNACLINKLEGERLIATDRVVIEAALQMFGQTIQRMDDTGLLSLRGGAGSTNGAEDIFYGKSHATSPGYAVRTVGGHSGDVTNLLRHHNGSGYSDWLRMVYTQSDASYVSTLEGRLAADELSGTLVLPSITIADDAVGEIVIPAALKASARQCGGLRLFCQLTDRSGQIFWRYGAGYNETAVVAPAGTLLDGRDEAVAAIDLTTTSATDGRILVAVNAAGNIHINNRSGGSVTLEYALEG